MRKLLGIALVVAVLVMPAVAKAEISYSDYFSGTSPSGIWSVWTNGGGSFYQNGGSGGVLNFMAAGTGEAEGQYSSNFSFDLNHDFYVKTQFNYSQTTPQQGGVGLGFYSLDKDSLNHSIYVGSIDALYGTDNTQAHPLGKYFVGGVYDANYNPVAGSEHIVSRSADSGWLGMYYDSALDKLQMGAFISEPTDTTGAIGGAEFSGLRTLLTDDRVGLSLSGWTDLSSGTLAAGEATFDNFTATSTVPEPVSTILFITGGAVLAVRRLRRK